MPDTNRYDQFRTQGCCVIIPTYNNEKTLAGVIRRVREQHAPVIVIDDGSTDRTAEILREISDITVISLPFNHGKGFAIRTGFGKALELGFRYAITLDSDGQHLPEDLPLFLDELQRHPGALILGARDLAQAGIPGGTTFGNRFSNFWTWVETGYRLPDTQSGYRLYPVEAMKDMKFVTRRFEFEIEVLVRAAWKGIPVHSVAVRVVYPKKEERVSHFRPFKDFARISLLNTCLVLLALLYFRPWMILRNMQKEGFRELVRKHLLNPEESNFKKAASIGLGVFMGIAPVWGWQMIIALGLAMLLRLNKAITLIASNISIPPMIPFILLASYLTGGLLIDSPGVIPDHQAIDFEFVKKNFLQYILGALTFGLAAGLLSGSATWVLLTVFRRKQQKDNPTPPAS